MPGHSVTSKPVTSQNLMLDPQQQPAGSHKAGENAALGGRSVQVTRSNAPSAGHVGARREGVSRLRALFSHFRARPVRQPSGPGKSTTAADRAHQVLATPGLRGPAFLRAMYDLVEDPVGLAHASDQQVTPSGRALTEACTGEEDRHHDYAIVRKINSPAARAYLRQLERLAFEGSTAHPASRKAVLGRQFGEMAANLRHLDGELRARLQSAAPDFELPAALPPPATSRRDLISRFREYIPGSHARQVRQFARQMAREVHVSHDVHGADSPLARHMTEAVEDLVRKESEKTTPRTDHGEKDSSALTGVVEQFLVDWSRQATFVSDAGVHDNQDGEEVPGCRLEGLIVDGSPEPERIKASLAQTGGNFQADPVLRDGVNRGLIKYCEGDEQLSRRVSSVLTQGPLQSAHIAVVCAEPGRETLHGGPRLPTLGLMPSDATNVVPLIEGGSKTNGSTPSEVLGSDQRSDVIPSGNVFVVRRTADAIVVTASFSCNPSGYQYDSDGRQQTSWLDKKRSRIAVATEIEVPKDPDRPILVNSVRVDAQLFPNRYYDSDIQA